MPEMISPAFLSLVGELYEAATDETKWAPLAPRIAALFSAESCAIQARDPSAGGVSLLSVTANITPAAVHDYVVHYCHVDEWANRAARTANDGVLGQRLISPAELARTEFADYQRQTEMYHVVGGAISEGLGIVGAIGVHRKSREFDEADLRLMEFFLPHLRRSFQVTRELAKERIKGAVALEGLERLAIAALLVDATGHVLFANRHALALLRAGDALRAIDGRIAAASPGATGRLKGLIAAAAKTGAARGLHPGGQVTLPRREDRPLTALVSPVPYDSFGLSAPGGMAMLFVRDPAHASVTAAALVPLFGFTAAEARVAEALVHGSNVEDFARERGISVETVRTHVKAILSKTYTNRQSELVALILNSSAALGGAPP